jgi:hypothetical protein
MDGVWAPYDDRVSLPYSEILGGMAGAVLSSPALPASTLSMTTFSVKISIIATQNRLRSFIAPLHFINFPPPRRPLGLKKKQSLRVNNDFYVLIGYR